jgi:hypothetical protein
VSEFESRGSHLGGRTEVGAGSNRNKGNES